MMDLLQRPGRAVVTASESCARLPQPGLLQAHDTPVHEATRNGNLECLRALLDAKANIHAENKVCHHD